MQCSITNVNSGSLTVAIMLNGPPPDVVAILTSRSVPSLPLTSTVKLWAPCVSLVYTVHKEQQEGTYNPVSVLFTNPIDEESDTTAMRPV